jgi:hypothetical protein
VSLTSSLVEVSVVAAVGLLAKIGVLEGMFVGNMDPSSWLEFVEMVRIGQVPKELCEVEGGDVRSSVCFNLHACVCSCRAILSSSAAHYSCLLTSPFIMVDVSPLTDFLVGRLHFCQGSDGPCLLVVDTTRL